MEPGVRTVFWPDNLTLGSGRNRFRGTIVEEMAECCRNHCGGGAALPFHRVASYMRGGNIGKAQ